MIFDLDNMDIKITNEYNSTFGKSFEYIYNGKRYFYKKSKKGDFLNEIIAEKIANKLGIPCCHYIITYSDGIANVSSEMFDTKNYISLSEILESVYKKNDSDVNLSLRNNLEDIWFALDVKYGSRKNGQEIVSKLMSQIVRVFLFDVIIANSDRNPANLGFIDDGENVELAPLFDNDFMLSEYALYDNDYSIFVDQKGYEEREYYVNSDTECEPRNTLEYFFSISASEYQKEISEMLKVISRESLEEIFDEIQEDVIIPKPKREEIISNFELNRNIINQKISSNKVR